MKTKSITVRRLSKKDRARYERLDRRWACREKITRAELQWLMDNRRRYETFNREQLDIT
jgi:hypothetical protein